ncbi:MAG TPA: hypothetical protein ENH29_03545 [Bacteroidetes bacterium]|nr:hypothetical protein [Bacteroidota bacterium]
MGRQRISGLIMLVAAVLLMGCFEKLTLNDSENNPPEIPEIIIFKAPSSVNAPQELQTGIRELNNQLAPGYTYLSIATINHPEIEGNQVTWNVSAGVFKATIVANKKVDETTDWTVTINGSDDNHSYNNWLALQGNSTVDGKAGDWHIFSEQLAAEIGIVNWSNDANNLKKGLFLFHYSGAEYEIVNRPDKSGSFTKKLNGIKVFESSWDNLGSGNYTRRDANGNVVDTGNWS